ncbi:ATP-binding protein [Porticoccus sp.]
MRSIRLFLIAAILAVLTLFNFVAALQGYRSSLNEAEQLFDRQLYQTVELIANLHTGLLQSRLAHQSNLAYQVWHDNKLVALSSTSLTKPISDFSPGFGHANFDGYRWRTLVYYDTSDDNWVIAAERTDLRYALAENVIAQAVLPILLGIPLAGLLIWLIVSRGLKPLRDLSEQLKNKQANDLAAIEIPDLKSELEQVNHSINALMHRLGSALDREKRFTADAAHELRTPISALKVQLHNLRDEVPPGNEAFAQLEAGVERMQHLVEQLLSLYRSTPEEFSRNFTRLNLYQLAQEVIAGQHEDFEKKQQLLELVGEDCFVEGDPFALTTLLQNLLSNANKYTPEAGSVRVTAEPVGNHVCLKVEDSGAGISPTDYSRVFERFQRLNNKREVASTQGCGLGLTIVRHIADLHHARASIAPSSFDSGAAFIIFFNKARDDQHH